MGEFFTVSPETASAHAAAQPTSEFFSQDKQPAAAGGNSDTPPPTDTDSNLMKAIKGEDTDIPLTDHTAATEQGALNVIQGVSQGVQGLYGMGKGLVKGAITGAKIMGGDRQAEQDALNSVKSAANAGAGAVSQVPGAIRDINQSDDPVARYLQVAGRTSGQAGGQALVAAGTEGLSKGVTKLIHSGPKTLQTVKRLVDVPAALDKDATSTLATVAHNEGLPPLTSGTTREAVDELADSFIKRAKAQYKPVDDAVGGDLKPVQDKIRNLKTAIREQDTVNPDLADKYREQLVEQQTNLSNLIQKAKANGVPNAEALIDAGDKDYARGMAGKDVSKGIKTASGVAKMGGNPHPTVFINQIDKFNNTGKLARFLGDDGADAMLNTARQGMRSAKQAASASKVLKYGAGAVGAGGLSYAGYHGAKAAFGEK